MEVLVEKERSKNRNWLKKVVGIRTPIMIASGTLIDENYIVTNKHVVEDHQIQTFKILK